MLPVYATITHSLWITILGLCATGWGLSLVVYLVSRARARKATELSRRQMRDLASQLEHHERQHYENRAMLLEVKHQLFDANAHCVELEARVDKPEHASPMGEGRSAIVGPPQHTAPLAQAPAASAKSWNKLQEDLSGLRRTRDLAEQRAEALRAANQEQMRKNAAMSARIEELTLAVGAASAALTEKERERGELSAQLSRSMQQIDGLSLQLCAGQGTARELSDAEPRLQESARVRDRLQREVAAAAAQQRALTQQLEERTSAYSAVERMLQDSTSMQLQLRRDLQAMTQDREQLEQQNLELKLVLDQMGDSSIGVQRVPPAALQSHPAQGGLDLSVDQDWETVTESDIHQVIVGVTEKTDPVLARAVTVEPAHADGSRTSTTERELREAQGKIEVLEAGMNDLVYLREQNAKLSDDWAQDRAAARELTALQLEHKRLQMDLQLATEKLTAQERNVIDLAEPNAELQERRTEQEVISKLNRQVRDLDAENFALRNANSGTYQVAHPVVSESRELSVAPLDSAVLSDNLGLAIAAIGSVSSESLAAVSGLALSNAQRVRELLPVGQIATVQWVDQYGMTVTSRLLNISGDEMAMTTFGAGLPSEEALHETLRTVLGSIGWTEKGPISDDETHIATG